MMFLKIDFMLQKLIQISVYILHDQANLAQIVLVFSTSIVKRSGVLPIGRPKRLRSDYIDELRHKRSNVTIWGHVPHTLLYFIELPHNLYLTKQFDNFVFQLSLVLHNLERDNPPSLKTFGFRNAAVTTFTDNFDDLESFL